jgi:hypothetical protein
MNSIVTVCHALRGTGNGCKSSGVFHSGRFGLLTNLAALDYIFNVDFHAWQTKQLLNPMIGRWKTRVPSNGTGMQGLNDFSLQVRVADKPYLVLVSYQLIA